MPPIRLLFLCTANSARSQLAEALLQARHDPRIVASSAGTHPAAQVHPVALEILRDRGIDSRGATPKRIDMDDPPDVIVSVCDSARDECPVVPGVAAAHWGLPDPAAVTGGDDAIRSAFRATAAVLDARIEFLLGLPLETLDAKSLAAALETIAGFNPAAE